MYLHPELALGDTDLEVYTLDQLEPGLSPDAIYNITNGREGQEVIKVHNSFKKITIYMLFLKHNLFTRMNIVIFGDGIYQFINHKNL